jgi:hypothetical protein
VDKDWRSSTVRTLTAFAISVLWTLELVMHALPALRHSFHWPGFSFLPSWVLPMRSLTRGVFSLSSTPSHSRSGLL